MWLRLLIVTLIIFVPLCSYSFCFEEAGAYYGIHPDILRAIASVESSMNPYAVNFNKDGSFDYGLMQINSRWYNVLGHERWIKLADPCFNVKVGAWILAGCIKRFGYTWQAVGCYNAADRAKRVSYVRKVMSRFNLQPTQALSKNSHKIQ